MMYWFLSISIFNQSPTNSIHPAPILTSLKYPFFLLSAITSLPLLAPALIHVLPVSVLHFLSLGFLYLIAPLFEQAYAYPNSSAATYVFPEPRSEICTHL